MNSEKLEKLGSDRTADQYNENKLVKIYKAGRLWSHGQPIAEGIQLYLENDFKPNFGNTFGAPLEEAMKSFSKVGNLIESVTRGAEAFGLVPKNVRWKTKYSNIQGWKDTTPIKFTMDFSFKMGQAGAYDGRTEVYNPIAVLAHLALPYEDKKFLYGPGMSYSEALNAGLAAQFATMKAAMHTSQAETSETSTKSLMTQVMEKKLKSSKTIKVEIGRVVLFKFCFIKNCGWSFSKEQDSNGFPISGKINLNFETYTIATASDIPIRRK